MSTALSPWARLISHKHLRLRTVLLFDTPLHLPPRWGAQATPSSSRPGCRLRFHSSYPLLHGRILLFLIACKPSSLIVSAGDVHVHSIC